MKDFLIRVLKKIIDANTVEKLINKAIDIYGININSLFYFRKGIMKFQDEIVSGESFVITKILPQYIPHNAVFFDVGANIGGYSSLLAKNFESVKIYSFEPNPNTFKILKENLKDSKIEIFNWGFGNKQSNEIIYVYTSDAISGHASLYKEFAKVITPELGKLEIMPIEIEIQTIDAFCGERNIDYISFIKIDVEGHELAVLQGALNMLRQNKIKIIQFEFNVSNILSRVFLKDFYDLLGETFEFYRLDTNRLVPLGEYDSSNEIFQFQNILVINKSIINEAIN